MKDLRDLKDLTIHDVKPISDDTKTAAIFSAPRRLELSRTQRSVLQTLKVAVLMRCVTLTIADHSCMMCFVPTTCGPHVNHAGSDHIRM